MEGQQSQERQYNPGMRRVGIIIGIIMLLSAAETIWKHGLKNWDWVQSAAFAGMGFVMATEAWPAEPQKASWWPQRILYLLWRALFIAGFPHEVGWVPGLCFAA